VEQDDQNDNKEADKPSPDYEEQATESLEAP
jgi:hypothetical protein